MISDDPITYAKVSEWASINKTVQLNNTYHPAQ